MKGYHVPGPRAAPRPGAPRAPPSGRTPKVQNVFRFKLDAKSVPEALAESVRILLRFSIDLAHRKKHIPSTHPDPSSAPHLRLIRTPAHPLRTLGPPNNKKTKKTSHIFYHPKTIFIVARDFLPG